MTVDLSSMTPEQVTEFLHELAVLTLEYQKERIDELTLYSVPRAAGMLDLSTPQARRVLKETIDFGPQNTRISLADLQKVIDARRTKAKRKKGTRRKAVKS